MKRILALAAFLLCGICVAVYFSASSKYPELLDGDLIFQTSTSDQSSAIFVATGNLYTHMGIIKKAGSSVSVVEAVGTVRETPLKEWVDRGLFNRVAIFRAESLSPEKRNDIINGVQRYYGRSYDVFFSLNNKEIYCSELPYLAYKKAGISIGKIEKVSDLNFDNILVKKLIQARWQKHPGCKSTGYDFEKCYQHILNQDLVTPASIAQDPFFTKIYSNYLL